MTEADLRWEMLKGKFRRGTLTIPETLEFEQHLDDFVDEQKRLSKYFDQFRDKPGWSNEFTEDAIRLKLHWKDGKIIGHTVISRS